MKICAVICEFNPFHNGHEYLLYNAKKLSGCDAVLCIMSGNFVQRASYAIADKSLRTKLALENGADFVVELPTIYATACGELFAKGAVDIISSLGNITHLAFGCECGDAKILSDICAVQLAQSAAFRAELKNNLDKGQSYAKALANATIHDISTKYTNIDSSMCDIILSKPNNLLAIEYIKQILRRNLDIELVAVKRIGAEFNDENLYDNLSSASAIRQRIECGELESVKDNMPSGCFTQLAKWLYSHAPNPKIFEALILDAIRTNPLDNLLDAAEGLQIKLKKNAERFSSFEQIVANTKSKRYTHARIRRLALEALLKIEKHSPLFRLSLPIRLLGVGKKYKDKIGIFADKLVIQGKDIMALNNSYSEYIAIEKHAASIYGVITNSVQTIFSPLIVC